MKNPIPALFVHTTPSGLVITDHAGRRVAGVQRIIVVKDVQGPATATITLVCLNDLTLQAQQAAPLALGHLGEEFKGNATTQGDDAVQDLTPDRLGSNGGK